MPYPVETGSFAQALTNALFSAEKRRLDAWKDRLIRANNEAKGKQLAGFLYKGKWHQLSDLRNGRYDKLPLAFTLVDEMEKYLKDEMIVDLDRKTIQQTISRVVGNTNTLQDIRDALPDCLAELCHNSVRSLSRTREEAWPLRDSIEAASNERAMRQYEKIKPKIEFYATTRLIY